MPRDEITQDWSSIQRAARRATPDQGERIILRPSPLASYRRFFVASPMVAGGIAMAVFQSMRSPQAAGVIWLTVVLLLAVVAVGVGASRLVRVTFDGEVLERRTLLFRRYQWTRADIADVNRLRVRSSDPGRIYEYYIIVGQDGSCLLRIGPLWTARGGEQLAAALGYRFPYAVPWEGGRSAREARSLHKAWLPLHLKHPWVFWPLATASGTFLFLLAIGIVLQLLGVKS
jgi:hypothetical protein